MTNLIDVHIIKHPSYERAYSLARMLEQLQDEPVNVHLVEGELGHIGIGRYRGFTQGDAPYVSYVDDDDIIIPGVYKQIHDSIVQESCDAYCTNEIIWENGKFKCVTFAYLYYEKRHAHSVHHVATFKRSTISPYLQEMSQCADGAENVLWLRLFQSGARVKHIPFYGYVWKIHEGNSTSLKIGKDPKFYDLGRQLMELAMVNGTTNLVPGNRYLTPEEIQQCQTQYQMLQSFLTNLE